MICLAGARTLKLTKLAPIFPALILAACSGTPAPPPPQAIRSPIRIGSGQGIDLATDARDVLNELKNSRVEFVARYYREPESRWPALSSNEAQSLSSQGLRIVAVWESHSRKPAHFSYSSGYSDAVMAYQEARATGQPTGSAIYFAVDFNAQSQWLPSINEYFRGIAAGFAAASGGNPQYAVGVYGSGAVCDSLKRTGMARYAWLSNSIAWTGSIGYQDWNIRQSGVLPELSFNHDADEARNEYGGFQLPTFDFATSTGNAKPGDFTEPQFSQNGQPASSTVISSR
jgi:Domain of unknown function (DUF1906)